MTDEPLNGFFCWDDRLGWDTRHKVIHATSAEDAARQYMAWRQSHGPMTVCLVDFEEYAAACASCEILHHETGKGLLSWQQVLVPATPNADGSRRRSLGDGSSYRRWREERRAKRMRARSQK